MRLFTRRAKSSLGEKKEWKRVCFLLNSTHTYFCCQAHNTIRTRPRRSLSSTRRVLYGAATEAPVTRARYGFGRFDLYINKYETFSRQFYAYCLYAIFGIKYTYTRGINGGFDSFSDGGGGHFFIYCIYPFGQCRLKAWAWDPRLFLTSHFDSYSGGLGAF